MVLQDGDTYAMCKISCDTQEFDKEVLDSLSLFVSKRIIERSLGRIVIENNGFSVYLSKSV